MTERLENEMEITGRLCGHRPGTVDEEFRSALGSVHSFVAIDLGQLTKNFDRR